eukprot:4690590-Pyramimonas_sp.AAC.1
MNRCSMRITTYMYANSYKHCSTSPRCAPEALRPREMLQQGPNLAQRCSNTALEAPRWPQACPT